jgi:hypothetical protein
MNYELFFHHCTSTKGQKNKKELRYEQEKRQKVRDRCT